MWTWDQDPTHKPLWDIQDETYNKNILEWDTGPKSHNFRNMLLIFALNTSKDKIYRIYISNADKNNKEKLGGMKNFNHINIHEININNLMLVSIPFLELSNSTLACEITSIETSTHKCLRVFQTVFLSRSRK